MIPVVTVSADKDSYWKSNPGIATQEQVFLLSIKEVETYFTSDAKRMCMATAYAEPEGYIIPHWWLRTPGRS